MYFKNNDYNNPEQILSYTTYHPYRILGEKNPDFNEDSKMLLDLKESKSNAIQKVFDTLNRDLHSNAIIAIVPSSTSGIKENGLYKVVVELQKTGRTNASSCLVRYKNIEKLARGGDRQIKVHLNSIKVENQSLLYGRYVVLLDDITTSGNSLNACKQLLLEAGAKGVQCLAIGKTEGY